MDTPIEVLRVAAAALMVGCAAVHVAGRRPEGVGARVLAGSAIAFDVLILAGRAWVVRFVPLGSVSDVLVLVSLLMLVALVAWGRALGRPAAALVCLVAAALVGASAALRPPPGLPPVLRSALLPVHVAGATAAYACFTLGFVLSLCLLLSRGEGQDRLSAHVRRFALAGWVLYAVFVIGIGMLWARRAWGRYWGWDPKETASFVALCVCGVYAYFEVFIRPRSRALRAALGALACAALIGGLVLGMRLAGLHSAHQAM